MTTLPIKPVAAALFGVTVLSACSGIVSSGPNIDDYVTACMFETNARGSFTWSDGDTSVTSSGSTPEDTAAMNACIRTKAAADGIDLSAPAATPAPSSRQTVEVEGGPPGRVTETFTYGTPPAESQPEAMRARASEDVRICRMQMVGGTGYACR